MEDLCTMTVANKTMSQIKRDGMVINHVMSVCSVDIYQIHWMDLRMFKIWKLNPGAIKSRNSTSTSCLCSKLQG